MCGRFVLKCVRNLYLVFEAGSALSIERTSTARGIPTHPESVIIVAVKMRQRVFLFWDGLLLLGSFLFLLAHIGSPLIGDDNVGTGQLLIVFLRSAILLIRDLSCIEQVPKDSHNAKVICAFALLFCDHVLPFS